VNYDWTLASFYYKQLGMHNIFDLNKKNGRGCSPVSPHECNTWAGEKVASKFSNNSTRRGSRMKQKLGEENVLYPMPTVLVGATVNGKPNFITIAHVGIMTLTHISLGINKVHYTNQGIKEHETFSVNIPSETLVKETDYVGLVTGKKVDKSKLFSVFYGALKTAPMIEECSINMECRLDRIIDFENHEVFIGEVLETYADNSVLSNGKVDVSKIRPLLFDMPLKKYWSLGSAVADCWNIGKELKKK